MQAGANNNGLDESDDDNDLQLNNLEPKDSEMKDESYPGIPSASDPAGQFGEFN